MIIGSVGLACFFFSEAFSRSRKTPENNVRSQSIKLPTDSPAAKNSNELDTIDSLDNIALLKFALKKQNLDLEDFQENDKTLTTSGDVREINGHEYQTKISKAISISGVSSDGNSFVALIETAEELANENTDKDGFISMEINNYQCSLLVLKKNDASWRTAFYKEVDKSEYSGSTRGANSCGAGYQLTWDETGHPKLMGDEKIRGPYAGGNYSKSVSTISWKNKTYTLEEESLAEGRLETVEKIRGNSAASARSTR